MKSSIILPSSYRSLPAGFLADVTPRRVERPQLILKNDALLARIFDSQDFPSDQTLAHYLSGSRVCPGREPLALAYAGHQFGHFTNLGDGRAHLLGEVRLDEESKGYDLQLKGSGPTPYSRGGDGLGTLSSMLREYLFSEAMAGLGIPSTRSLAVVSTGEQIWRNKSEAGGVVARIARSHIRVGTFERLRAAEDYAGVRQLADYTINRHFADLEQQEDRYQIFLERVVDLQCSLVARWQAYGFIHGVMNTDNTAVSGETIDFGPCAFMETFEKGQVYSSIDRDRRYAFNKQPEIIIWNLSRLAETILHLLAEDQQEAIQIATDVLKKGSIKLQEYWNQAISLRIGISPEEQESEELIKSFYQVIEGKFDYNNTFLTICGDLRPDDQLEQDPNFSDWYQRWLKLVTAGGQDLESVQNKIRAFNPVVIPRPQAIERALMLAAERGELAELQSLLAALRKPFDRALLRSDPNLVTQSEKGFSAGYRTFCGT